MILGLVHSLERGLGIKFLGLVGHADFFVYQD